MRRYGFGEQTGTTEKGNLPQYENGEVEFTEKAAKWATQKFPTESPAGAVALALAEVGGVNLADHVDPAAGVDWNALRDAVTEVDGVGEETAEAVVTAVQEAM